MADNVTLPGTGSVVAADEVGGAVYQRVKVALGADGAAADLAPGRVAAASAVPAVLSNEDLAAINAITTKLTADPATQTTLAAILAKIIAAPATEAKQDTVIGHVDGIETLLGTIDADTSTLAGAVDGGHLQVDVLSGAGGLTAATVNVTPTCEAAAYHAGDVLFDSAEIASAARANGTGVELVSLIARDKDDNTAAAMTLFFFNANTSLGTKNAVPDIDDTEIDTLVGMVTIPAAAWVDVGASKVANLESIGRLMHAGAATTSLWVAATTAGTPTQTASGITLTFQFIRY